MKKIVPFNNILEFNTDVKEITAISLEHEINKSPDMISGVFYISGEYKIAEGLLDKEKFNFELPFDIALSNNYRGDSLLVDIDDFRYELISDKSLKVNIDLYIDGEIEEPAPRETIKETFDFLDREFTEEVCEETIEETNEEIQEEDEMFGELLIEKEIKETEPLEKTNNNKYNEILKEEKTEIIEPERIELLKEMLTNKEEEMPEQLNITNNNEVENENINKNIFDTSSEENYVTYRVYKVLDSDNLDTILSKYNITKEQLSDYNNIESINPGDKLIIPTYEK